MDEVQVKIVIDRSLEVTDLLNTLRGQIQLLQGVPDAHRDIHLEMDEVIVSLSCLIFLTAERLMNEAQFVVAPGDEENKNTLE